MSSLFEHDSDSLPVWGGTENTDRADTRRHEEHDAARERKRNHKLWANCQNCGVEVDVAIVHGGLWKFNKGTTEVHTCGGTRP